ncbi:MAG: DUF4124 domain-containing protein [Betaproteobacteria bacterium]|nr:DUF4124 domain-containing protein [Betaproteobacteria bacterium]
MKSPIQFFAAIAILLATATVAAQVYKWVDKDGKIQYSDTPPPPGATKAEPKKVETGPGAASAAPAPAKSLQDRAQDYDKRKTEAADQAKKAGEAQKKSADNDENCKAARTALQDLESGRPIRRTNEKGELAYMTDEERQAEISRAREVAAASCKA